MIVICPEGTFGPFNDVIERDDHLDCDGVALPFAVIGDEYAVEEGNPPPVPMTDEQVAANVAAYMAAVQKHMDDTAVSFGYDHLLAAISYAEEPSVPRYQAEGLAFRAWRSQCWFACELILADVLGGQRAAPTHGELLLELPAAPVQEPL